MLDSIKQTGAVYIYAKKLFNAQKKNAKLANGWELEGYLKQAQEAIESAQNAFDKGQYMLTEEEQYYCHDIVMNARKLAQAVAENNPEDVSYYNKLLQRLWADFEEYTFTVKE